MMETRSFFDQLPVSKRHEVEAHLDILNKTAPQINQLENKLSAARSAYQQSLNENSNQLKALSKRLSKCIQRVRPYYELKQGQVDLMKKINSAVERYNKADNLLHLSRETFSRLENQNPCSGYDADCTESLEAVNQCIWKVNTARLEVLEAKAEHEELLVKYNQATATMRHLENRYKLDIKKAEPYFMTKQRFDELMAEEKLRVEICHQNVSLCKSMYADTMSQLELISNSLHQARSVQPRTQTEEATFIGATEEIDSDSPLSSVRGEGVGADSLECISDVGYGSNMDPGSIGDGVAEKFSRQTTPNASSPLYGYSDNGSSPTSPSVPMVTELLEQIKHAHLVFDQSVSSPQSSSTSTPICHSIVPGGSMLMSPSYSNTVQ